MESLTAISALTVALACAGLWLGFWIGRRQVPCWPQEQAEQVAQVLSGLFDWTSRFSGDVSRYRTTVGRLAEQIRDVQQQADDGERPDVIVDLLKQLVAANENVQKRLTAAELKLQTQADEIAAYVCEARTDTLTGLPNRRAFDDELARRFAEQRRHADALSLMLIDVDHFKRFNDTHGHLAGDRVLAEVARSLRETMRECDMVARFGGEEFAVILPRSGIDDARRAAERARSAVHRRVFSYEGRRLQVAVSCGAAESLAADKPTSLIGRADAALYAAKRAGRNQVFWHDGDKCRPAAEAAPEQPAAVEAEPQAAKDPCDEQALQLACHDLRKRLREVIAQGATPTPRD